MAARGTAVMLSVVLVQRFARGATNGERQRTQPLLRDLDVTLQALPVVARIDPADGFVQPAQRVSLALEERKVHGVAGARLRVVADVTHLTRPAGAPIAHSALHVLKHLAPAVVQQALQFCASCGGHISTACGIDERLSVPLRTVTRQCSIGQRPVGLRRTLNP